jgi:Ca2+-binding EF-hand superfamily protein
MPTRPNGRTPTAEEWVKIKSKLPFDVSETEKKKRQEIFRAMDVNGSGQLSLAEVDKGLRDILRIDDIFEVKPVIIRAFEQVKDLDVRHGDATSSSVTKNGLKESDYVGIREFRMLLQYLYHYFVLWEFFETIDQDGEGRLSMDEFKAAQSALHSLGVKIENVEAEFHKMAGPSAHHILFSQFSDWALKVGLQNSIHHE